MGFLRVMTTRVVLTVCHSPCSFLRVDNGSYIALYSIICFWNWIHFNQLNWVILHLISDVLIYLRCHIFRCSTSFRSITYLYEVFKVHIDCFISHQKTQSFLNSLTTGKSSVYLNSSSLCNGWYTFRTSMFRWSVRLGLCERLSHTSFLFWSGSHLLSHAVSSIVPSAAQVLTIVFGMGTGVSPERIATGNTVSSFHLITE